MIKAVLLDLDDTLLHNANAVFVSEYLRLVDEYFEQAWGYTPLSRVLLKVMHVVNTPRDLRQTNTDLAIGMIAEVTGQTQAEIRARFEDFYATNYPVLEKCVEAVTAAPALVEHLLEANCTVVIATNPLYPAEAIRQRLAWAGLPDDFGAYALVTNGDNMHFAKPDPAYYAEILARIGVEPDEALMVGDDPVNDILPAATLGLNTYHIRQTADSEPEAETGGSIQDLYARITQQNWLETLLPAGLKPEAIEPQLRGNIGALFGMLSEVKAHQWDQHPDPEEWSILQIVCHLLESEKTVQRPRLEKILAEDNPFLASPQPPAGPREAVRCATDGWQAAERFVQERMLTIEWLRQLKAEDWQRPARHSIFGLTTMAEMAHFTAQHDRLHLNQLCQTLGRCE